MHVFNNYRLRAVLISLACCATAAAAQQATPPPAQAAASPGLAWSPSKDIGVFVFGKNGQTSDQQLKDESECYGAAKQQSGIDPKAPAPPARLPNKNKLSKKPLRITPRLRVAAAPKAPPVERLAALRSAPSQVMLAKARPQVLLPAPCAEG